MAKKRGVRRSSRSAEETPKQSFLSKISLGRIISVFFSIIIILILLSFLSLLIAVFIGPVPSGNIAVIPITGMITAESSGYGAGTASSKIVPLIKEAEEKEEIKAIILDINSGGGSPVGSDEIAAAVKASEKPTVAVIREVGASGAYWIASSADKIYANRMSLTGSIGVIGAYLEFARMLDDYNITYRSVVSGKYKDMGSPFKELTAEEQNKLQKTVDQIHNFFVEAVAENRNMSKADVAKLATGELFLGVEAKEMGLVDELGSKDDAVAYIEEMLNITADLAEYRQKTGFFESLSAMKGSLGFSGIGENKLSVQT